MNRRLRRLAGVGFAVTAVAATGLLGVSTASGNPAMHPVASGHGSAGWYGGDFGRQYEAYEDYLHARERYERVSGRYDYDDDRRYRDHDHDHDRRHRRGGYVGEEGAAWIEGNYHGLSPYQGAWIEGLIQGSDYGQDFVLPYGHPGHPLANFPPLDPGPSFTCSGPNAPYSCTQGGTGGPGAPAPGTPSTPSGPSGPSGPSSPSSPTPGGAPPATSNPGSTSRPSGPRTITPTAPSGGGGLVPSASGSPQAADPGDSSSIPLMTLLLVFLASTGSVGAGYLVLRRRGQSPLAGD